MPNFTQRRPPYGDGKRNRPMLAPASVKRPVAAPILTRRPAVVRRPMSAEILKLAKPAPPLRLVLGVTTYSRVDLLNQCLQSWHNTKSGAEWTLIIADDGSTDGTVSYIKGLSFPRVTIIPVFNNRVGISHQTNDIFRVLRTCKYDFAFKVDDDVLFKHKGWDLLYYNAAQRTKMEHLVLFDEQWYRAATNIKNFKPGITADGPLQYWRWRRQFEYIQGAFFTVTPKILDTVGYFDEVRFGLFGGEHKDFTLRCCKAGFSHIPQIWDAAGSQKYVRLATENYRPAVPYSVRREMNPADVVAAKNALHELTCCASGPLPFLDLSPEHSAEKHPEAGLL